MVEETNDSSCLNYKQIRHQFEEYDLSDLFETPKKNTTPKSKEKSREMGWEVALKEQKH